VVRVTGVASPSNAGQARPVSPLRHRAFTLMLLGTAATFCGYSLLLSVVPLWVVHTGAGEFAAGASTGVFMAATVGAQLCVPALVRARGYRAVTLLGALLLGLPAPLLILATDWPGVLALSLIRGLGFGLVTVCGSALIAELLPADSLARGSGWYGLGSGLPQLAGLGLGTWLAQQWGFTPVFLLATALPLAGILPIALLPKVYPSHQERTNIVSTVDATWRPWVVMLAGSIGFGSLVTFLPILLTGAAAGSLALIAATGCALLARWAAGAVGDRLSGPGRLLPVALGLCMLGMGGVAAGSAGPLAVLVVIAAAVFGFGFGAVQNDSLVAMFARVPAGPASVVWNVAFDAGTGAGAVAVGAVVAVAGYPGAFGALAVIALALIPVAVRARARRG
jgi:predicted MFS family arabinose efflux permease